MNAARIPSIAASLTLALGALAGCAGTDSAPETDAPAAPAATVARGSGTALRIEQAERKLDLGRNVEEATATLKEVLRDPTSTPEQRDQARLSLSRALEMKGDTEGAIQSVEAILAEHGGDHRWPMQEAVEGRLRKLLTGSDGAAKRSRPEDTRQPSAIARILAKSFTPEPGSGATKVNIFAFGGDSDASDRLGTFAIDRALRANRREACPLCDEPMSIHTSSSRSSSWVSIPGARAKLATSLAVFYFDLGDGRIPARYDDLLPVPSAEVAAHLERGEGLVAARERPGAPPVILIAAPREAQLADVEEVLSEMKALPAAPVVVPVKAPLKPQEIQGVVRGSFKAFRECYETLLKQNPTAYGKVPLRFAIQGDGLVTDVAIDGAEATLREGSFDACMTKATSALVFPAAGVRTTVTYPLEFSPGDDAGKKR